MNPGATERSRGIWQMPRRLLAKEHEKAIFDVPQAPSGILAHAPGEIDKMREFIVGLQTDLPKRTIIPFGGWRVVVASLQAYGYKADPAFEPPNGRMVATLHREGRVRRHRVLHPCISG
jgi:formate C-acetyltransferase